MILRARYVVPVDGVVIEDGVVVVEGGRIAAVGPARDHASRPITDYGDAVICPGFVNAHTHLELGQLAGRVPPGSDFVDWLRRLVGALSTQPVIRETVQNAVRAGIAQSLESGVTLIGDITRTPGWTREVLAASALGGVSFGEVIAIGNHRHLLAERLEAAASEMPGGCPGPRSGGHGSTLASLQTKPIRVGISPHAPYTVEPDAMRACARRAHQDRLPLCIHLAETAEEELFTRSREGPLAGYLRDLGVWDDQIPAGGCGPVELARRAGLLGRQTVIAHANYVTDEDIALIAASGASVAYCPRTHHAFGHSPHRFRDMLDAGINVCVGTDSLASSSTLSILDELRFLRQENPGLSNHEILTMGTIRGARALGFAETTGTLRVGNAADLAVVRLGDSNADTGWGSILESTQAAAAVYVGGRPHHDLG